MEAEFSEGDISRYRFKRSVTSDGGGAMLWIYCWEKQYKIKAINGVARSGTLEKGYF